MPMRKGKTSHLSVAWLSDLFPARAHTKESISPHVRIPRCRDVYSTLKHLRCCRNTFWISSCVKSLRVLANTE